MIPSGEPFPGETLIADGWVYRDMPKVTQESFNKFLDILGEENARFLTFARYPGGVVRGQFLMSPAGMERLKAYSPLPPADRAASEPIENKGGGQS